MNELDFEKWVTSLNEYILRNPSRDNDDKSEFIQSLRKHWRSNEFSQAQKDTIRRIRKELDTAKVKAKVSRGPVQIITAKENNRIETLEKKEQEHRPKESIVNFELWRARYINYWNHVNIKDGRQNEEHIKTIDAMWKSKKFTLEQEQEILDIKRRFNHSQERLSEERAGNIPTLRKEAVDLFKGSNQLSKRRIKFKY